jgi:hypothetical protein
VLSYRSFVTGDDNRTEEGIAMNRTYTCGVAGLFLILASATAGAADTGKITYAKGNCFVIQTAKGVTLFERSGGKYPKTDDTVAGVLDDFGYQQLRDPSGSDLMVGFVQEYGVTKEKNIEKFKKFCR